MANFDDFSANLLEESKRFLEKSLLGEKEIELIRGEFILTDKLKIHRLTDRIQYLYFKYKKEHLTGDNEAWWGPLNNSIKIRNSLVHPKEEISISYEEAKSLVENVIACLLCISRIIYKKEFPFKNLGLQSKLTF